MDRNIVPGPVDQSLLHMQADHRSSAVWDGQGFVLKIRRGDFRFHLGAIRHPDRVDDRVQRQIIDLGLFGSLRLSSMSVDHALITALIERWRSETNTFHFPIGEMSITLQDMEIIAGLRTDGDAMTYRGVMPTGRVAWAARATELLGANILPDNIQIGPALNFTFLRTILQQPLPENAPDGQVMQRTRVYVLLLMGGFLFSDASSCRAPLRYLLLLENFNVARSCSWGGGSSVGMVVQTVQPGCHPFDIWSCGAHVDTTGTSFPCISCIIKVSIMF